MRINMQPKTVDEYRDLTKVLKLKIVKQSKIIQQLQQKCRKWEDQVNNATFRMTQRQQVNLIGTKGFQDIGQIKEQYLSTLKGKSHVMKKFLRAANMFGITPQSIYRIADFAYSNSIQSDYFRTVISKMALSLSPRQISCLIFIFDQNCLGYISKDEYQNSLHAYEIGVQQRTLPYTQDCLLRLCQLFNIERTDLNKFYDQMKTLAKTKNNGQVDLIIFEEQIKKHFAGKLQQREIMGAFNQINLEKQKSIEKKNFLYSVNSFTNRLFKEQSPKVQISSQFQGGASNLKNSRLSVKASSKVQNSTVQKFTDSVSFLNKNNQDEQLLPIDKLLREKMSKFQDIISSIVQMPIKTRISIHQFKKNLSKNSSQLSPQQLGIIFRAFDVNQEGSIDIFDIVNFALTHCKDVTLIFRLLGKAFQVTQTRPDDFWASQQFEDFSRDISKGKFIQIMANSCETKSPQNWDIVWDYFDKGKQTVSVQSIVDVWRKYYVE